MKHKEAALAAVIGAALVSMVVVMFLRGRPAPPHAAIDINNLSIAISNYTQAHGYPKLSDPNREMAKLLVESGKLGKRWVTNGELLDRWGTPYAIFIATVEGSEWSYPPQIIEIAGQSVSPDQSARVGVYQPLHQVISAGPDRTFGTGDDLTSWSQP